MTYICNNIKKEKEFKHRVNSFLCLYCYLEEEWATVSNVFCQLLCHLLSQVLFFLPNQPRKFATFYILHSRIGAFSLFKRAWGLRDQNTSKKCKILLIFQLASRFWSGIFWMVFNMTWLKNKKEKGGAFAKPEHRTRQTHRFSDWNTFSWAMRKSRQGAFWCWATPSSGHERGVVKVLLCCCAKNKKLLFALL